MRAWKLIIAFGVLGALVIAIVLGASRWQIRPLASPEARPKEPASVKHVLLPASETAAYARYYLATPSFSVGSWQPDQADLAALEVALPQVSGMKAQNRDPRHINGPDRYFLQFLPIIQHGKRKIFVSASCELPGDEWRHRLQIITDGGECFWQAYFDPTTRKFSNLSINGRA